MIACPAGGTSEPQCLHLIASSRISSAQYGHLRITSPFRLHRIMLRGLGLNQEVPGSSAGALRRSSEPLVWGPVSEGEGRHAPSAAERSHGGSGHPGGTRRLVRVQHQEG